MPRLSLLLYRHQQTLIVFVEHQDEDLRNNRDMGVRRLASDHDFRIESEESPGLFSSALHIRGYCRSKDCHPAVYTFDSVARTADVMAAIRECVRKINSVGSHESKQYPGWTVIE